MGTSDLLTNTSRPPLNFDAKDVMQFPADWGIVVLSGKAKSGKDSAADYICERILQAQRDWGMYADIVPIRLAFADELKRDLMTTFQLSREQLYDQSLKEQVDPRWGYTPRYLMQWYGEHMRSLIPRIWVTRMERKVLQARGLLDANWNPAIPMVQDGKKPLVILSDGRHANELVPAFNHPGGITIRIIRDDQPVIKGGIDGHASEEEMDHPEVKPYISRCIHNPGPSVPNSLKRFQEEVYSMVQKRITEAK